MNAAPAGSSRSDNGGIAVLTLTRTQARNTLSEGLLRALTSEFVAISADKRVRVVVIAAQGPAFCAGHDMKEMTARRADPDHGRAYFKRPDGTLQRADAVDPQPAATGDRRSRGLCDSVPGVRWLAAPAISAVASETARFANAGRVDIGLFCSTPMVALSRNVSNKHAMGMLLTGELLSADDAYRIGLVNRVVARGKALDQTLALAQNDRHKVKSAYDVKTRQATGVLPPTRTQTYRRIQARRRGDCRQHDGPQIADAKVHWQALHSQARARRWEDR